MYGAQARGGDAYPKLKEHEGSFDHRPREPFSLLFVGPHDAPMLSAEHTVHHDQLGAGRFFIIAIIGPFSDRPASPHARVRHYEIVFG